MTPFAIFSTLPADARIFVVLGDSGSYANVGDSQTGVAPADFEAACRATVANLEASNRGFVKRGICKAEGLNDADRIARNIYERNSRARVEFHGNLEGLTLYLGTRIPDGSRGLDAWPDALNYPWVFEGARFESPEGEYACEEAAARLVAVAAMVVRLGIASWPATP